MAPPSRRNLWPSRVAILGLVGLILVPVPGMLHGAGVRVHAPRATSLAYLALRADSASTTTSAHMGDPGRLAGVASWQPSSVGSDGSPSGRVPHPAIVNPLQFYSTEPAPMGIADFGVTGKVPGASAYAYSSPSFEGQAIVRSLSVSIGGTSSKVTAFELNAVVVLQLNGTNYSYWIQNGLHLDAGSDEYTIGGAYVWNFSSPTASLSAGQVQGASGSAFGPDVYYYIPGCGPTYPGQCTTLSLPTTLTGRILTATSGGIPYVAYQYDIGAGWVTYDNVSFPRLANATDAGFQVDGFVPTPYSNGVYYDAEWVWVGAGGGSASTDKGSDIDLSLDRWNGHNYQAIGTAWDFGSNTGETSSNVTESETTDQATPAAFLANGPGTLGVLYNQSQVGFLNLTVPALGAATLLLDGQTIPFAGGWANLTLPAGSHSLYLRNFTNASDAFVLAAGTTDRVNLSGAGAVTFNETGLPAGTSWGVTVNGTPWTTAGSSLTLHLANGSYPLTYRAVPGYSFVGTNPTTLTLPGTSRFSLQFARFTYEVTFTESGLPATTPWWVNASGLLVSSTGATLQVAAPNGSTTYTAGSLYEFLADPSAGTIVVSAGVAPAVAVSFSYRPTFIVGTVTPASAVLSIGGVDQPLTGGAFNDSVTPGSYAFTASAPGYVTAQGTVTATPGNVTWENLTLQANQTQPPPPTSTSSNGGGLSVLTAALVVAAVAVAAVLSILLIARRRR